MMLWCQRSKQISVHIAKHSVFQEDVNVGRVLTFLRLVSREIQYLWAIRFENGSVIPGVTSSKEDRVTPTMWNKQNLVINAGILEESTTYEVSLTAWYKGSSKRTVITMERKTGRLPFGGSCIAT